MFTQRLQHAAVGGQEDVKNMTTFRAIGLMSGTSLDGMDAAFVETDGQNVINVLAHAHHEFSSAEHMVHQQAVDEARGFGKNNASIKKCARLQSTLAASLVGKLTKEVGFSADVIGFHGQTLLHEPDKAQTLQVGDADLLCQLTGIPVIHQFRLADVKNGGQGAPLVPIYHQALLQNKNAKPSCMILNIGGVGNITYLGRRELIAFDTGPGNGLMNDLAAVVLGAAFDQNGQLAASGRVHEDLVTAFLDHPYFDQLPPKSLDRHDFDIGFVRGLSSADAMATLCAVTARCVVDGLRFLPEPPHTCFVAGGGRFNKTLMGMLQQQLPFQVCPIEDVQLSSQGLESEAFAYLAVRFLKGLPSSFPSTTGCKEPTVAGTSVGALNLVQRVIT